MKKSSKDYKPHVVDEATKSVYLTVNSWSGSMVAPHWVDKHYKGYKCVIVTEQVLTDKLNDNA